MQSFGERLRQERETRNTTIEEIAAATGIHRGFLEALEKNEFQALPGRAFGKFYLRAYAEILDFDPEPLIVHYDQERRRDPPEPMERPPDEPTLRRVEASLAKWRASKAGSLKVAPPANEPIEAEPEIEAPAELSAAADDIELAPPATEPIEAEPEIEAPAELSAAADDIELAPPATMPIEAEPEIEAPAELSAAADDIELAPPATMPIEAEPEIEAPAELSAAADDIELAPPATMPIEAEPEIEAPAELSAAAAPPATEPIEAEPEIGAPADDIELAPPAPEPVERSPDISALPRKQLRSVPRIAAAVGGVGLLVALYLAFRPSPPPVQPPAPATTAPIPEIAASAPEPIAPPPQVQAPPPVKPTKTTRTSKPSAAPASPLTISDFGVGRDDETARVEIPAEPFREGDVVAFSTRVRGGRAGQSIRHVWLHRGLAVQSIRLRVGAADWRTHSTKTLWGAGPWSVEARDEAGNVLARAAFDCVRR